MNLNFFSKAFWLQFSSPKTFYPVAGKLIPWFGILALILTLFGLYLGFFTTPKLAGDQKEYYHIIFIHVPAAWMSMLIYFVMGVYALLGFVLNARLSGMMASALAPTGAMFTVVALWTGALWGRPAWGTYWEWDPRLTSELVLLFLYLGFISLQAVIPDIRRAIRAGALLAIVGVVFLPIIYFAVNLNAIHQASRIVVGQTMPESVFIAMIVMVLAFWMYSIMVALMRVRVVILEQEKRAAWTEVLSHQNG